MTKALAPAPKRTPAIAWRRRRGELPRLDELPIPADVRPGPGWTEQMVEMADHIGAQATLAIVAGRGGEQVYVPADPAHSPFAELVDASTAATISQVYAGNRLSIPVARVAVNRARRAVVIAAVRAGKITAAEAQKIIGTSRTYVSYLVNHTDEGRGVDVKRVAAAPAQPDLFTALLK